MPHLQARSLVQEKDRENQRSLSKHSDTDRNGTPGDIELSKDSYDEDFERF